FVARDPERPDVLGDMRYSLEVTSFSPLWGLRIGSGPEADVVSWGDLVSDRRASLRPIWGDLRRRGPRGRGTGPGLSFLLPYSDRSSCFRRWLRRGSLHRHLPLLSGHAHHINDPEARVGQVSSLFSQARPAHRQAQEPRHLQDSRRGAEARAG